MPPDLKPRKIHIMSGRFFCLILSIMAHTIFPGSRLFSLAIAPLEIEIQLTDEQQDILQDFAKSLEKENFQEEARFYHFAAVPKLQTNAVLLQDKNQFFILIPTSIASLSNQYTLNIIEEKGKKSTMNNLLLRKKNDVFWLFEAPGNEKIFSQLALINIQDKEESLGWFFNLTLLTAPNMIDTFSNSQVNQNYQTLGSIVLGSELQPIGVLSYINGQVSMSPMKDIIALLREPDLHFFHQPSLATLTLSGQNFSQEMQKENLWQAANFFSLDLVYRFGYAAYLALRSNIKTQNLVTRSDIRKAGLAPFRRALITFFNEQIHAQEEGQLRFRIVVSLADEPVNNSSIVTFSLNKNIVSTSWRWQKEHWLIESLPLSLEDQLVPFLELGRQEDLVPDLLPFSGMTFNLGTSFLAQAKRPSASLGYHYNLSKYLSLDFSLGYDILWYRNFYQMTNQGTFSANFDAEFITLKTGLRLQYPLIIMNRVYIMPFAGINMGMAFLTRKTSSDFHSYFNELLINRLPLTLLIGWNSGLEFGFRAGIPMALGILFSYQQDFFGQQTLKKGPSGSINPSGGADLYYISLYYKIALPPKGTHNKQERTQ